MRTEIFHALEAAELDDPIRVTVIRGAGKCFSSGYDLKAGVRGAHEQNQPFYTAQDDPFFKDPALGLR